MQWKVDCTQQLVMTSSVIGLRRGFNALPKAKLAPRKDHGHCLVVCCPSDPLQLSESWWNPYIWELCSANRWDAPKTAMPATGIGQQKRPNSSWQCPTVHHTANTSKVEQIGRQSFASSIMFIWPLANRLPDLQASQQLFAEKCFHNQQDAENAFQEFIESWNMDLYAVGINKQFFFGKNVLIEMVPILMNKDMFESWFIVQNCNYICTNLI